MFTRTWPGKTIADVIVNEIIPNLSLLVILSALRLQAGGVISFNGAAHADGDGLRVEPLFIRPRQRHN